MEEDTVELINYLRVIWKRKILIIVVTLVCMVAGVVVSLWTKRPVPELPPVIYRAEVLIKVGMKLGSPPSCAYQWIDDPEDLTKSIPIEYDLNVEVKMVAAHILKVSFEGIGKEKVEELLKGVINRLIADHLRIQEDSAHPFGDFIEVMEAESERIQKHISLAVAILNEIDIAKNDVDAASLVFDVQNQLLINKEKLERIQYSIRIYRQDVSQLEYYRTKLIGGVEIRKTSSLIKKKRGMLVVIIIGALAGMMLSMSLAFFVEYLENVKKREEEKNSV